jgi:hypothetical protein
MKRRAPIGGKDCSIATLEKKLFISQTAGRRRVPSTFEKVVPGNVIIKYPNLLQDNGL